MGLITNQTLLPQNITPTLFAGVSSVAGLGNFYNIDIVRQDLKNALYSGQGQRVMQPNYGNISFNLVFELQNPGVVQELQDSLTAIINSEPRVQLQNMTIQQMNYGYIVTITVLYLAFQTVENLVLTFNSQISSGVGSTGI